MTRDGALLAAGGDGVWTAGFPARWRQLWKPPRPDDEVVSLYEDREGRLLAGTRDGFFTLTRGGGEIGRQLRGRHVTCFAESLNGKFWVGTWDAGVLVFKDGEWEPLGDLPGKEVTGIVFDVAGRVWVGLYGHGLLTMKDPDYVR